jgi:hypothetical protein
MDEIKRKKPNFFLGCFGFSEKQYFPEKSGSIKTVPVNSAVKTVTGDPPAKTSNRDQSRPAKAKLKWKFKRSPYGVQAIAKVETKQAHTVPKTRHRSVTNINLENTKSLDNTRSPPNPQTKAKSIQPDPDSENRSRRKMRHSVSLPIQKQVKESKAVSDLGSDPMVGVSIIIVTLIIMVLWGRLCAILCTAAWFYLVPRFRHVAAQFGDSDVFTTATTVAQNNHGLSSEEYKKKVILDGFLNRNRKYQSLKLC